MRPARAVVSSAEVQRLQHALREALEPRAPGLLIPGRDLEVSAAEERAGRALSRLVYGEPELLAAWSRLRALAESASDVAALVVDSEDPQIRALPWELLTDGPAGAPLESGGGVVIVRLGGGRVAPGPSRDGPWTPAAWEPDPEDPVTARLHSTLNRQLGRSLRAPSAPEDESARLCLYMLCHGRDAGEGLALGGGAAERSVGTALHPLSPVLPRVDLAVLCVCEGAASFQLEVDEVVGRLLWSGVAAAVAPRHRVSPIASAAFCEALQTALDAGEPLPAAAAAGRRAVRALALPFPDARWWSWILTLGDLDAAASQASRVWRPEGWPRPGPSAAPQLARARAIADSMGSRFVGLEHLALALSSAEVPSTLLRLRYQISTREAAIRAFLNRLIPVHGRGPDWRGTPRLQRLGPHLSEGFGQEQLWERVASHARRALVALLGTPPPVRSDDDFDTWTEVEEGPALPRPEGLPVGLEVIGGPDDGRRIFPAPGDTIGRWSESGHAAHALYEAAPVTDPGLSRRHLRWLGEGKVNLLSPATTLGAQPEAQRVQGETSLRAGEYVALTGSTWLVTLAQAEHAAEEPAPPRP